MNMLNGWKITRMVPGNYEVSFNGEVKHKFRSLHNANLFIDKKNSEAKMDKSLMAISSFIDHIRESQDLLDLIEDFLDDHMHKDPEALTWADTGDAERMKEMLSEIVTTFNLRR